MKKQEEITMKCIVETTGEFMLLNIPTMEEIPADRPAVVFLTPFIDVRINRKELKVLARDLPKHASDEDFAEVFNTMKDDKKAAVAAFCAEYGIDVEGNKLDEMEVEVKEEELTEEEKFLALFTTKNVAEEAKAAMEKFELKIEDFTGTGTDGLIKVGDVRSVVEAKQKEKESE